MSWGYKILITYLLFMAGIVTLVVKTSVQNQDLVVPDYYEQELQYQDKIDAIERTNELDSAVHCKVESDSIHVSFPPTMRGSLIEGDILLYCPTDKKKDLRQHFNTTNAEMRIPIPRKNKGWHKVKINWAMGSSKFYSERQISLP